MEAITVEPKKAGSALLEEKIGSARTFLHAG